MTEQKACKRQLKRAVANEHHKKYIDILRAFVKRHCNYFAIETESSRHFKRLAFNYALCFPPVTTLDLEQIPVCLVACIDILIGRTNLVSFCKFSPRHTTTNTVVCELLHQLHQSSPDWPRPYAALEYLLQQGCSLLNQEFPGSEEDAYHVLTILAKKKNIWCPRNGWLKLLAEHDQLHFLSKFIANNRRSNYPFALAPRNVDLAIELYQVCPSWPMSYFMSERSALFIAIQNNRLELAELLMRRAAPLKCYPPERHTSISIDILRLLARDHYPETYEDFKLSLYPRRPMARVFKTVLLLRNDSTVWSLMPMELIFEIFFYFPVSYKTSVEPELTGSFFSSLADSNEKLGRVVFTT